MLTLLVCGLSLTAHWAFLFWYMQHLRELPELASWTTTEKSQLLSKAVWLVMLSSIAGNFLAAWLARRLSYRRAIALLCLAYFLSITATYGTARGHSSWGLWCGLTAIGLCQGVFALFTMYLPPLFPTLLRTTGAGLLLQLRPHRRRRGDGLFRPGLRTWAITAWRSSTRASSSSRRRPSPGCCRKRRTNGLSPPSNRWSEARTDTHSGLGYDTSAAFAARCTPQEELGLGGR